LRQSSKLGPRRKSKVQAKVDRLAKGEKDDMAKRIEAEAKVREARAQEIAKKQAELAAKEAKSAAADATEEAADEQVADEQAEA